MSSRLLLTACVSAAILSACATQQENPFYKYSSKYPAESQTQTVQVASTPEASPVDVTPVSYRSSNIEGYEFVSGEPSLAERQYTIVTESDSGRNVIHTSTTSSPEATRIVNQCVMSAGVETCHPVAIPVSTVISKPVAASTQNNFLIPASSARSDARLTQVESDCVQAGAVVPCYPQEIDIQQNYARIAAPYSQRHDVIMAGTGTTQSVASTDSQYGGEMIGTPGYYATHSTSTDYTAPTENFLFADSAPTPETTLAPAMIEAGSTTSSFGSRYISSDGAMLHRVVAGDTVYSLARKTCSSVSDIQVINGLDASFSIRQGDTIRLPASGC